MQKPLVSIITITFNLVKNNRINTFRQCLQSVHDQAYKNIEHLVIDGNSQDGTREILETYEKKGWIKFVSEPDTGVYDAMNKGILLSKGKYLAFLNSDDFYHDKNGINESVKCLEKSKAAFSYAPVINLNENTKRKDEIKPNIKNIFFTIMPNHQTMLFNKRIIVKENCFNTKYKCVGDYDMTVRLCLKNYDSVYVKNSFATYRLGGFSEYATKSGLVFKEVSNIYYENYKKLFPITLKQSEKICGDIYSGSILDIPIQLAIKLKPLKQYFNYDEYMLKIEELRNKNVNNCKREDFVYKQKLDEVINSKSWKISQMISKAFKIISFRY